MKIRNGNWHRRYAKLGAIFVGGVFIVLGGFFESCDARLATLANFVDPCGTILANCQPGDIQVRNADIGDYCIDPSCTVPGACGNIPLGTITNVCP